MKFFMHHKLRSIVIGVVVAGFLLLAGLDTDHSKGIPVLNYHLVNDSRNDSIALSVKEFDDQMNYLHRHGYTSITPDQLLSSLTDNTPLPEKPVLITFDDGYQDVYTNAYPVLQKYGYTATLFLITDVVGHNNWYLDWDQVREMQKAGFVIGSHTLSHVLLTNLTPTEIMFQLTKSKEGIEYRLECPVKYFAYPGGDNNQQVQDLVKQAGYAAAFTVNFGRVGKGSNLYALDRIPILKSHWTFYDFWFRLTFTPLVEKAKTIKSEVLSYVRS